MFKASIKKKAAATAAAEGGEDDDSDWESVEEDFPHVKLSELLDGLTLEVNNNADEDDDEAVQDESAAASKGVTFAVEEERKV